MSWEARKAVGVTRISRMQVELRRQRLGVPASGASSARSSSEVTKGKVATMSALDCEDLHGWGSSEKHCRYCSCDFSEYGRMHFPAVSILLSNPVLGRWRMKLFIECFLSLRVPRTLGWGRAILVQSDPRIICCNQGGGRSANIELKIKRFHE